MKLKQEELIRMFPWANHPSIRAFAAKFTPIQWQAIHNTGFPLIQGNNGKNMDPMYFESFLLSCEMALNLPNGLNEEALQAIVHSFVMQIDASPFRFQEVLDWLGAPLFERIQLEVKSNEQMLDLMQLLSLEETRHSLENLSSSTESFSKKDARILYLEKEISFGGFFEIAKLNAKLPQRVFPEWVKGIEAIRLADEFTNEQLILLTDLVSSEIKNKQELLGTFLRSLLLRTEINSVQMIKTCAKRKFISFVNLSQEKLLEILQVRSAELGRSMLSRYPNQNRLLHELIRKYVSKYQVGSIPTTEENSAVNSALRSAITAGDFWDVLLLINMTKNVNFQDEITGKTALHQAVEYMNQTGNRLCFEILAKHPGIDFSIRDASEQAPLDLWNFHRYPDRKLFQRCSELQKELPQKPQHTFNPLQQNTPGPDHAAHTEEKKTSREPYSSPLVANSTFQPKVRPEIQRKFEPTRRSTHTSTQGKRIERETITSPKVDKSPFKPKSSFDFRSIARSKVERKTDSNWRSTATIYKA